MKNKPKQIIKEQKNEAIILDAPRIMQRTPASDR
jgi:hypothetical protein